MKLSEETACGTIIGFSHASYLCILLAEAAFYLSSTLATKIHSSLLNRQHDRNLNT